jgi:DNA-binding MltR family transcriptional regulator
MAAWFLTPEISMDAIIELYEERPRAAAIVGATILDTVLTATLMLRFRDGTTRKELFDPGGGPLGDYVTKTKLAYTLGILSTQAALDIKSIGEIRNKFAHRLDISSFEHEKIVRLCMGLKVAETNVGPLTPSLREGMSFRFLEGDRDTQLADPKKRFVLTVKIITNGLMNRPEEYAKLPFPPELI